MPKVDQPLLTLSNIEEAANNIKGAVLKTPFLPAIQLDAATGASVFVKYENMQVTNAFKERGALNKLLHLSDTEKSRGVIAMSAGNHAQAVALHAQRLGIPALIVMPNGTPYVKVEATKAFGAKVILAGETVDDAKNEADRLAQEHNYTWVHPFDDLEVIAGQGTIALEMLREQPDLDTLVVPVGGGGMISGMAVAAKAIKPDIEIIGVESDLYPSMYAALRGRSMECGGNSLAEGIAVKVPGTLTQQLCKQFVNDVLLVSESQIEEAINVFLTRLKTVAEGAGAAGLAAICAHPERFAGKKVGLVLCGGNINPRLLASIMLRQLLRLGNIIHIRCTIPDNPGILGEISTLIGELGGNILEVSHHRLFLDVSVKGATLDVAIETRDSKHADEIIVALEKRDIHVSHLSSGEMRF
ncbi:L-threonine dehydratase catabolic TdcB [Pseudovibrio axinellae]|uniref:L-threonine dehydratase catabolic TdcB n=1 Tax=Pseudovibrio axinellae TaxID=989403 RepID=A0A165WPF2_9HYPH|nr:threonine ammonia-lyase [Pseudovibrio axinellae]KZL16760.1 L-threonine dehydratase catabolic TdcB [Pseudovibrio axinellae]SEQ75762.1 L-threonine ammonia-lyase [Pseudovibrio axinellae]